MDDSKGEAYWRERAEQLQHALDSRIVVEQAKGILSERVGLDMEGAFALLRYAARGAQLKIHHLAQSVVELVDTVTRLGANVVSFARLAAFGITHAAIAGIVWAGTVALWVSGPLGIAGAVVLFVVGTALAFGLEALVAGIQALRLEYYELFSRVFTAEGRPFHPWLVPVVPAEEVPR